MNEAPIDQLSFARFSALLATKFRVRRGTDPALELELTEATRSRALTRRGAAETNSLQECFSLIFAGPDDRFLPQGNYRFEHELTGWFDLFIVPVGRAPGQFQYQAVINRLANLG